MPRLLTELETQSISESNIELVFFDIDGTLIGADGNYSNQTQLQINRIQQQGIKTAIASGRPHYAAQFMITELGLSGTGLFCSGGSIYEPKSETLLLSDVIPTNEVQKLLNEIEELGLYCELYGKKEYYFSKGDDPEFNSVQEAHSRALRLQPTIRNFSDIVTSTEIVKLLVGAHELSDIEKLKSLETEFNDYKFAYAHMASHPNWVFASILNKSVDKTACFKFLCDHHRVKPQNVMAIGDAHSDIDFIQSAGVGVAMGNANSDVKAIADWVTLPVSEDGAAFALAKLIPESKLI